MTVRITVSLPDEIHAGLVRLAEASHVSASAVVRMIMADAVPKMTSVLDYLGTITPERARQEGEALDAWARDMRALLHEAPETLGAFRATFDEIESPDPERAREDADEPYRTDDET